MEQGVWIHKNNSDDCFKFFLWISYIYIFDVNYLLWKSRWCIACFTQIAIFKQTTQCDVFTHLYIAIALNNVVISDKVCVVVYLKL